MTTRKIVLVSVMLLSFAIVKAATYPIVHAYHSTATGIYSNAYVVELEKGVVVVDATLTVSSAKDLRGMIDDIGKQVYAVLITHGHPDHYNGLTEIVRGLSVPIYSTKGVLDVIEQYDAAKDKQWRPMFGDEWPVKRTFPNHVVKDGESLKFESTTFTVFDLGPGESHSDTYWVMQTGSHKQAFIGDVVLNKVHAYVSDGHVSDWLKHLDELKLKLKDAEVLYPGHGLAGGTEMLDWQRDYLNTYLKNVRPLWSDKQITEEEKVALTAKMKEFLPNDRLTFLIGLGAESAAKSL